MSTLLDDMMTPVCKGADVKHGEEVVLRNGTPVIAEIIHQDNGVFCMPVESNIGSWICASKLYRLQNKPRNTDRQF